MKLKQVWKNYYIYILSIGLPALIMLGVWIGKQIGPGGYSLIMVDGLHQYMPFFSDYYEKLTTGGSLFYSFQEGLGTNFLSLWSYYLSSPLNILIVLFPKAQLNTAVSLIVTLKIVLSGWTFAYAALHWSRVKYQHPGVIPLAVAWAMSNYVIGYYWNVMWMDCIMIFPLIILGFDRLAEKKDMRLYVLTLFYALWCNYFIGFMICLFLIMWTLLYPYRSLKQLGRTSWQFAVGSLVAAGLAGIVLVPAYKGIMETASATRVLPGWDHYGSWWNLLQAQLLGVEPINNQVDDGGLNLYCGMFTVFLFFVYLFGREFRIRDKVRYLFLLAVMFVSFNTEILNYIWHGFHNQYGIPNRFSFLYIFVLLWMGYEVLLRYRRVNMVEQALGCAATLAMVICCFRLADSRLKNIWYILSACIPVLYLLISFAYRAFQKKGKLWRGILAGAMTAEMIAGACIGWAENGRITVDRYFGDTEAISQIVKQAYEEDPGFYRMEIGNTKMLDEPTWHNLRCLTLFGSTARGNVVKAMGRLGFYTGANEYLYCGATPLTNAITSMKYVLYRDGDFNNNVLVYQNTVDGVSVYENPYWLPVGFCVNQELLDMEGNSTYFDVQNEYARRATGIEEPLFTSVDLDYSALGNGCTAVAGDKQITYSDGVSSTKTLQVRFDVQKNMDLYLDVSGGNVRQIKVYLDQQQIADDRYQNQAFHVGYLTEGQEVMLEFTFNDNGTSSGTVTLHSYEFHSDVWDAVYTELQKNPYEVETYRDGYLKGSVEAGEDQVLFTSIPYDAGWKVQVDGQVVEPETVMDAFMAIPVTAGHHEIEMKYVSEGFSQGVWLSVISLLIATGIWLLTVRYRKKHPEYKEASMEEQEEGIEREKADEEKDPKSSDTGSRSGNTIPAGNKGDSEGDVADRGCADDSVHY